MQSHIVFNFECIYFTCSCCSGSPRFRVPVLGFWNIHHVYNNDFFFTQNRAKSPITQWQRRRVCALVLCLVRLRGSVYNMYIPIYKYLYIYMCILIICANLYAYGVCTGNTVVVYTCTGIGKKSVRVCPRDIAYRRKESLKAACGDLGRSGVWSRPQQTHTTHRRTRTPLYNCSAKPRRRLGKPHICIPTFSPPRLR